MTKYPAEQLDRDPTDELPILTAAVTPALGAEQSQEHIASPDETDEHTAIMGALEPDAHPATPRAAVDLVDAEALEADIEGWATRCRDAEKQLTDKDLLITDLNSRVATARRLLVEQNAITERVAAQLRERTNALEASVAEQTRLREQLERIGSEHAAHAVAAAPERSSATPDSSSELQQLREDHAALAAYVGNRKQWWEKAQAQIATLTTQVAALEHELTRGTERLARAETLAERESERAAELREQAADLARQLRGRVQIEPMTQTPEAEPASPDRVAQDSRTGPTVPPTSGANAVVAAEPAPRTAERRSPERAEVVAQLEAEIEYKRQQVAAQLIELHGRDSHLKAATHDLEQVRIELVHTRAELEKSRTALARVENLAAEKDRALAARDTTIAALQAELQGRLGALQKLNARDLSLQGLDNESGEPLGVDAGDNGATAPTLLCLTDDAPPRITLQQVTTFGRAPHCDVQILTHYVSREHARIVIVAEGAMIEDLGSRNGVFVNGVKVERQRLHQGDLIQIGETQFRYFESVAH